MKRMHVCVLGAGGLGSVVGGYLAEAGTDVTLVCRPVHAAAVEAHGLQVDGIRGPRVIGERLRAVSDPARVVGEIDYLILVVKCRDTADVLAGAEVLRSRTGAVLSLQNSVRKDAQLGAWIGDERVIGASTTEAGTLVSAGVVRHSGSAPVSFYFGELDGARSERVDRLVDTFTAAGFGTRASDSITNVEWEKVLQAALVAAFSITTVGFLTDVTMTDTLQARAGAEHYVALALELAAVHLAMGFELHDYFAPFSQFREFATDSVEQSVQRAIALGRSMAERGVRGRPSMHEDLVRGRPTEVAESLGVLVGAADRLGVAIPTVRAAYRVVLTYEQLVTRKVLADVQT